MTTNNMYRVGDFVFFEASASAPYQIRRIEELNKTSSGAVKAKVVCFYRRRDIPPNLLDIADNFQQEAIFSQGETLNSEQIHQLRHRELFISRYLEVLPATHIRGKCHVSMSDETESFLSYIDREDCFFFQLVYDSVNKTLQVDRGSIRVGDSYQAVIPAVMDYDPKLPSISLSTSYTSNGDSSKHESSIREHLVWAPPPPNQPLTADEIDAYQVMCKSLATLARACYPPTALPQPSLALSAAAASRDSTLQQGLETLQLAGHNITKALTLLAPSASPIIRLDELEEWSLPEGSLFEEALEKYGKSFYDIQSDFLPWKSAKSVVAFYYMWKTTDHYLQQKRSKMLEAERKLKQVYIPNYNKPNQTVLFPSSGTFREDVCEAGCGSTSSPQWYALGPPLAPIKVCVNCWTYWKRYGDIKLRACANKLVLTTMVYKCPVKTCDEEFDCKSHLATHLDSKHPQYGSACASPIQPTVSLKNNSKLPCLNGNVGIQNNCGALAKSDTIAASVLTRIGSNFYFYACPAFRLARRLCPTSSHTNRRRRLLGHTKSPLSSLEMEEFKAVAEPRLKALSERNLAALRLACFTRIGSRSEDRVEAAGRLHGYTDGFLRNVDKAKMNVDEIDSASKLSSSSNTLVVKTSYSESNLHSLKHPTVLDRFPSFGTKNSRYPDSNIHSSQQSPARETSTSLRVPRTETLMFLAATALRYKRRKLISPVSLHRLCRQPWSHEALPTELRSRLNSPLKSAPASSDVDIPDSH